MGIFDKLFGGTKKERKKELKQKNLERGKIIKWMYYAQYCRYTAKME